MHDNIEWEDLSLCRGMDTRWFYDKTDTTKDTYDDPAIAKQVDEACLRCPVLSQCFMAGSRGEYGVWGGVFWNGSGKPDNSKNSHKTEDTWKQIYDRVRNSSEGI